MSYKTQGRGKKMTIERLREIDETLYYSRRRELYEFTVDDGNLVRMGEWGYMRAEDYEAVFTNEREQLEYQAINNADGGDYRLNTIESVTAMSDDELSEFLSDLNDSGDCLIYYTEAEE